MKCKYCGAEIGNSIECHLCGHKQIGKTTCPVCSKLIYPYQEYCSNCGSPTIYRKSEPIKKVTPDTSVHSEATVSYTHLRAHETDSYLVCRLLLEKKKKKHTNLPNRRK